MSEPTRVTIYSTRFCGYCQAAKRLLQQGSVPFEEVDLTDDPGELTALKNRTGHRTVPLVLLDGKLIGGYQELSAHVRTHGADSLR